MLHRRFELCLGPYGQDLADVQLDDFAGKRKVLDIVVSLDTGICAASARMFNEAAGRLPNTAVLVIAQDPNYDAALAALK